jgi:flagellar motor protein MotB
MPRPRVLGEASTVQASRAIQVARELSPQAAAHADRLLSQASAAYDQGRIATSQILGEQAVAAYHHLVAAARLVRAQHRLERAEQTKAAAERSLSRLEAEQQRVAAELNDLELRVRIAQSRIALLPTARTTPERESARREAAQALAAEARLLCTATRLLDPTRSELKADLGALDALDKKLRDRSLPTPIEEAVRSRSSCLRDLTLARRAPAQKALGSASADALLTDLGRLEGLFPYRDDRGVVITLRGLFARDAALTLEARHALSRIREVAARHPGFPILIVLHTVREGSKTAQEARLRVLSEALGREAGLQVETQALGRSQPLVDPRQPGATERNERVEVVFVSPTS